MDTIILKSHSCTQSSPTVQTRPHQKSSPSHTPFVWGRWMERIFQYWSMKAGRTTSTISLCRQVLKVDTPSFSWLDIMTFYFMNNRLWSPLVWHRLISGLRTLSRKISLDVLQLDAIMVSILWKRPLAGLLGLGWSKWHPLTRIDKTVFYFCIYLLPHLNEN